MGVDVDSGVWLLLGEICRASGNHPPGRRWTHQEGHTFWVIASSRSRTQQEGHTWVIASSHRQIPKSVLAPLSGRADAGLYPGAVSVARRLVPAAGHVTG